MTSQLRNNDQRFSGSLESSEWERRPLSRVVRMLDGDRGAEYPSDNDIQEHGVPFFSSRQIKRRQLTLDDVKYISDEKFWRCPVANYKTAILL